MRAGQSVVTQLPLDALWDDAGAVAGRRERFIGPESISELLRLSSPTFVIATLGAPLRWIRGPARFDAWKAELKPRLVERPDEPFSPETFPGGACFVASEWSTAEGERCVLFELHH